MLKIIFWVIILVLFLSFFGISVQSLFESPTTQHNFAFILTLLNEAWTYARDAVLGIIAPLTHTLHT